ncbi:glycosyltransferase [bacterium]|nr:glycosyltransferase [bacterium]
MSISHLQSGVSVVVPVYNSAQTLELLVSGLQSIFEKLAVPCELILVDDCSKDGSWGTIARIAELNQWVTGISLMRNYGQHNALLCGIRAARFDTLVTMDDDLQNPPSEIPKLLAELDRGFDVVYGRPLIEQHGLCRNLASAITKLALGSVMGIETARSVSAFRAFRTQVRDAFASYQSWFVSIDVLLTWGASRFSAVAVDHQPRARGVSNYTLIKLLRHAVNMLTGFSVLPLQLASLFGFLFALFGMGVLAYVLGCYVLLGSSVPGFPFLASIIAILSGVQLFALGVMGEYIARIHFRTMDRPAYAVRQVKATSPTNQR